MALSSELANLDALGLAARVRAGDVTPLELVDAVIARLEAVDGRLNAVVTRCFERARDQARGELPDGPFRGVPFFVKDLVQPVAGLRFTRGSRFFARDVATYDSTLITRYKRAGLILVGKTNTPEFGLTPFTEPVLHGPTHNPWALDHGTGGSSGGAAAVVAARVAPMAHGGDGGGSIRIPSSCCGVFGLKPTRGRTPVGPDHGEGWMGLALDHVLTLSVRDSAAALDATSGYEPGAAYDTLPRTGSFLDECGKDPGKLRIALCKQPALPGEPHRDVLDAADDAARLLESLGHRVEERVLPIDRDEFAMDFATIVAVSTASDIDDAEAATGRRSNLDDFEVGTRITAMLGRTIDAVRLERARRSLHAVGRRVADFMRDYDVILTPTLGQPPPRLGSLQPHGIEGKAQELIVNAGLSPVLRIGPLVRAIAKKTFGFIPYTPLANATGQPSASVPLYWNAAGLPIGVMLTGRFGDEATLFRLASQLEAARPWRDRVPPVHA